MPMLLSNFDCHIALRTYMQRAAQARYTAYTDVAVLAAAAA
jgi:hypothetical protein